MSRTLVLLAILVVAELGDLGWIWANDSFYDAPTAGAPAPWPVEARLFASDQELTHSFGSAVALGGNTAIVGARNADIGGNKSQGAAYIFVRKGGTWVEQAQLLAHDGAEEDWFGYSVAVEGDTAVVGAPRADVNGEGEQGAVYVYVRIGGEWFESTKLVASNGDELDSFGQSVAVDGDTLVAGAPGEEAIEGCETGAAYVFTKQGVPWIEVAKLYDPEGECVDAFGNDVALRGDTLLLGAENAFIDGEPSRGAAYVFSGSGSMWDLEQKLLPSDGAGPDQFGSAVALNGDQAVIGAWQKDVDGNLNQGAAYVFRRSGTTWTEEQRLTASDGQPEGFFGKSVALLDKVALVGAEFDFPGENQRGVIYENRDQGGTWVEIQKFAAPEGNGIDLFGAAIALTSERALISHANEVVLPPDGGSAWVFGRPVVFADGFETGNTSAWSQTVQ